MPGIVFRVIIYIITDPDESDYVGLHSLPKNDLHFEGHMPVRVLIPLSTACIISENEACKTKRICRITLFYTGYC